MKLSLRRATQRTGSKPGEGSFRFRSALNPRYLKTLRFYLFLGLLALANCDEEEKVVPQLSFETSSSKVTEGETVFVPFNIPLPDKVEPVFSYAGTAKAIEDYTFLLKENGLEFTAEKDRVKDKDETILITFISIRGNAKIGTLKTHTITIDEPVLPVVEFGSQKSDASEGGTQLVPFKAPLPAEVVPVVSVKGTAVLDTDFTYSVSTDGIVVTPVDDGKYDPDETIVFSLSGISDNAELGLDSVHTVTITESALIVEFTSDASSVLEGSDDFTIPVNMVLPAGVIPSVKVSGTATQGVDYTYLVNNSGVVIKSIEDGLFDSGETVIIELTEISGNAVLGNKKTHTVTLTEVPLVLEFQQSNSALAEGGKESIPFNLAMPPGVTPTISFTGTANPETDYVYTIGNDGISLTIKSDGFLDEGETIIITLTDVNGNAFIGPKSIHQVTITDTPWPLEFQAASTVIAEGAGTGIVFNLPLPPGLMPEYSLGGTATPDIDYTLTLTETGIQISTIQDGSYDPNETIIVTLTGGTGSVALGTLESHTITMTEPVLLVEFGSSSSSLSEGAEEVVAFNLSLPDGVLPAVTLGGTATEGSDFTYSVTASGIVVTVAADGSYDPGETIVLDLSAVSGNAVLGTQLSHTISIVEPALVTEFAFPASTLGEGNESTVAFNLTLPAGVLPTFAIGGTATQGTDFNYVLSSTGVTITAVADGLYDPNETVVLTLTGVSGTAAIGTAATHTITLSEPPLVIDFASSSSDLLEGDGGSIAYSLTLPSEVIPSLAFAGTATQGEDYSFNQTQSGISITTIDDGAYDPDETIIITIVGVTGNSVLGTATTHTITLTEPELLVEFAASNSTLAEGSGGAIPYVFTLPPGVMPTVSLGGTATPGVDFNYSVSLGGIQIEVIADGLYDPDETIVIILNGVSGNALIGSMDTHTITLSEPPLVVEFVSPVSTLGEGNDGNIDFNLTLPDGVVPTISFSGTAVLGVDYTYSVTSTGISVTALADGQYDPDEVISIDLNALSGNAVTGLVTNHLITITEPPLVVDFTNPSLTIGEGNGTVVTYSLTLPGSVVPTLSFSGTATQGADYSYSLTQNGVIITTTADGQYDPNESIIITLTGVSGNTILGVNQVHTLTLSEPPLVVEFSSSSSSIGEGIDGVISYNIPLPTGVTPSVSLSGTATPGTDFNLVVTQTGITVTTIADGLYDPNETIVIDMTEISGNALFGSVTTHTITVTEPPLVVGFTSAASALGEGNVNEISFTLSLPAGVAPTVSVGGTATQGTDYTYTVSQTGITVTALSDGLYDPNETVVLTLTGVTGNTVLGTVKTHVVTLTEPALVVDFTAQDSSLGEGNGNSVAFNISLPTPVTPTVTFGGTATQGTDYTYTITQTGITVTAVADALYDPNETVVMTLTAVSGNAILGPVTTHTITLTEPALVVEFNNESSSIGEGNGTAVKYSFTLPTGVTPNISLGGTASEGADYTYAITQTGISVTAVADGLYDPNETVIMTLTGVSGNAIVGSVTIHTITLTEPALVVELATPTSILGEGGGNTVAYNMTLPSGVTPSVSVGGTATQGTDFSYTVTQSGISVTTIADGLYDHNETIIFTLTGVSGNAVLGTVKTHTITLTEPVLVVEFMAANSTLDEGSGNTVSYNITLPTGVTPTVSAGGTATQGTDYTYTVTQTGITVTTVADGLYDPDETIIFTLTGVSGNAVLGTAKTHIITLSEPPLVVEFVNSSTNLGEGSGGEVAYNITLPSGVTPTVIVGGTATQGTDYTYSITQTGISVTVVADGLYDPNETIIFTLTGVSGNSVLGMVKTHNITLTEPELVVQFATAGTTLGEGGGSTVSYNITLPAAVTPTVTVDGTATNGVDYTYSVNQAGITVTTIADGLYDPNETIIFTLTGVSGNTVLGAVKIHTVTLTEPPLVVEFGAADSTLGEGNGNTTSYNITLPIGVSPSISVSGTATQGTDYSYMVTQTGIVVTTEADGIYDPNETIVFTLNGVSGNTVLGTVKTHTITLTEPPLVVEFGAATSTLSEGNSNTTSYNITLPNGVTPGLSVSGTATQGTDYTYNVTQTGINITTEADGLYDPNETIILTLTGVSGNAVLGTVKTHTITLTEPALVVDFSAATSELDESSSGTVDYNIDLPTGVSPTVSLGGSATQGTDYTYTVTQTGISITPVADGLYDPNETIIFTLNGVSGNAVLGAVKTHTITLTEPELVVEFASPASTFGEGSGSTVAYNITLPTGVTPTVSVGGTATQGTDYSYTVTQTGITVLTVADGLYDPNETIVFTLNGVSGNAVLGTVKTHIITLTEPALVVDFVAATSAFGEGSGSTVAYNITLPTGVTPTVSVGGTATQGTDYSYEVTQTGITVTTVADGLYDPNETIIFTLTGVSGNAILGSVKTHTITLTEPALVVAFVASTSIVGEGSGSTVSYNITLPNGVAPTVSVGGTATQGIDYSYSFTQTGINITTEADGLYDPNETIVITLTGVSGNAVLGTVKTHTITLTEPALVVEFAGATSRLGEGSGSTVAYNINLPPGVSTAVSLGGSATQGTDYTYTITQTGISLTTVSDGLYDPNETVVFTLTGVSGNAVLGTVRTHTVTLTEPELVVDFAAAGSTLGEGSGGTVAYNLTLPTGVTPTVSVSGTATQGADYTYAITQTGITVTTVSDGLYDPNETIIFTLTGVSGNAVLGTTKIHTITLTEPALVVEFAAASSTLGEGSGSTVAYNLTLPTGVTPTVSVSGTATQGADYTYAITQTGITVTTVSDGLYDPNETIIFTLTGVSGNAVLGTVKTHTITLTEPALVVQFTAATSTLGEDSSSPVAYNITLPTGVATNISVSGTATLGTDYTYTVTQTGIGITTEADGIYDPNETIIFTLTGVSGNAVLGAIKTHTITLTEPALVVDFGLATSTLGESSAGTVAYNINLPTGVTPTVSVAGTATLGTDYTYSINQNGVSVTAVGDGLYDPNETIIFTLTGISGNAVLGTIKTHTVTLTEPALIVQFEAAVSTLGEGNGSTVAYNIALPTGVTPTVSAGGTATQGTDYSYTVTQTGITVTTVADGTYDPNETIIFTLTGVSGNAAVGTSSIHTITLTEPALVVEFAAATSTFGESNGSTVAFNIELPPGVTPTFSVGGTATQDTDYSYTITQTGITIAAVADGLYDPNETVILTLIGVSGNAVLGTVKTHTITLTEPALDVQFATATSTLGEGSNSTVEYNITLPTGVTPNISIGGTATQGTDYSYTVNQSGITVTVVADGLLYDPNETIILTLTGVSGNTVLGAIKTHTITITEPALEVEFASAISILGEGNASTIAYNITLPSGVSPSVLVGGDATLGIDYTYVITPTGITLTAVADGLYDPNETVLLTLTGVTGNAVLGTQKTHSITLSEPPLVVSFAASSGTAPEGAGTLAAFNVPLPTGVTPTISFSGTATEGIDYGYSITSDGVAVTLINDGMMDPDETIIITLTEITGNASIAGISTYTLTITEAALPVEFSAAASTLSEGNGSVVPFNIILPTGITPTVSLGGTATLNVDYTYSVTQTGVSVSTISDGSFEPNETIVITLTNVSGNSTLGSVTSHIVTITEPALLVEFASPSSTLGEGNISTVAYNISIPAGVTPSVSVSGSATDGVDYSYSLTPNGILISSIPDVQYDPNETIAITLTGVSGNAITGAADTHVITLTESALEVEFADSSSALGEGNEGSILFNVLLPSGVTPSVAFSGSATRGSDYTYQITPSGITITAATDGVYDPNETIVMTLTGVSGNTVIGPTTTHTVTITENPIVVEFASSSSTAGEGTDATIPFSLNLPSGVIPIVSTGGTATLGVDYTIQVTQAGVDITVVDDGLYDPGQTVVLTLTSVSGNAITGNLNTHTVTLTEPPLVVSFSSASGLAPEGAGSLVSYNISLPIEVTPSVSLTGTATEGTDYTYNVTQNGVEVVVAADGEFDAEETIIITLTSITGNATLGGIESHTLTITEAPLVAEFVSDESSLLEGNSRLVAYTIILPPGSGSTISLGGSATEGSDYTYEVTQSGISINAEADGIYDPDETIVITLTDISGNVSLGNSVTHTITLTEAPLVLEFSGSASSIGEGISGAIDYNLTLPSGLSSTVAVGGTATLGSDYSYSLTQSGIVVNAIADGLYDPNETIVFTLTGVSGNGSLGATAIHTVTLTEPAVVVEFTAAFSLLGEDNVGGASFTVTLPSGVIPTVSLGGTATEGTDYTYSITQEGITVTALADVLYDPNESVIITLTGASGNSELGAVKTHTVTISEPVLVVEFDNIISSLGEGGDGTVIYNIPLPNGVTPTVTIGGTATNGTDYTYDITQTGIALTIVADGLYDPNETVIFTLTDVSGNAILGSLKSHTVTLTEPPLMVEFLSAASALGEGSASTVPYNITLPAGVTPTVLVEGTATVDTDYTYLITQTGISVTVIPDALYDPNETVVITLMDVSGNAIPGMQNTHTISLSEPALVLEFAAETSTLGEGSGGTVAYNITLPTSVTSTVTVGGTATAGSDYTYSVTQSGITVTAVADGLYDPNETVAFTLTGITGNGTLGAVTVHTVTLTEPTVVVAFATASSSLSEGNVGGASYTVTLPTGVTPTVSLGGTATEGTDYTYSITQTGITVTAIGDGSYDPNETVVITLTGASGNSSLGTVKTHTVTITEPALVVEFGNTASSLSEGSGSTVSYNIALPTGVTPTVTVGGTATLGTDYTYSITQAGISVTAKSDVLYDPNETVAFTLTDISGNALLGSVKTHTVTLTEPALVVEFLATNSTFGEASNSTVSYNFTLPEGVTPTVSVGGTATPGVDYVYIVTQTGIEVTSEADGVYDPNETVVITLTGVSGNAVLGTQTTHTITLTEPALVLEFSAASSILAEGSGSTATYNISLPVGVTPTLSVGGTATLGTDYTYSITQTGIVVTAAADGLYDPDESIVITLTNVSGNAVLGTLKTHNITLTEPPLVVEFADATSTLTEGNGSGVSYNIVLPTGVTPTVTLGGTATPGTDYTYSITSTGITITSSADGLYDPNETITLTLTDVSGNAGLGTNNTHTITLIEPALVVEFAATSSFVGEGSGSTVAFNITLPAGVTPTITLGGTATEGADFAYSVTQAGITLSSVADGLYDPNETVVFTLTAVSGNTVLGTLKTHTVTLTEPPLTVEFAASSSNLGEGAGSTLAYNIALPVGVTPTISLSGTATQGTDYSINITQSGITVSSIDDGLYDPNETVVVTLTGVSGNAVLGTIKTHIITLTEPLLVVDFVAAASSIGEDNGASIDYKFELPTGVTPVVLLGGSATQGTDFTYQVTQSGITINAVADGIYDPNETIVITLTGVSGNAVIGAVNTHTVTLTEPALVVEFAASTSSLLEGAAGKVFYTFELPAGVLPEVSIGGTATPGSDFTYQVTQSGISITAVSEGLYDPNETIIITLAGLSGNAVAGTAITHTVTITEPSLVVSFASASGAAPEGAGSLITYNIPLPPGVATTVELSGTASSVTDYTYSVTQNGVEIVLIDDGVPDADETIIITLTGVSGNASLQGTLTHTLTITEAALVADFGTEASSLLEGNNSIVPFSIILPTGAEPVISFGGTATENSDYTYSISSTGIAIYANADGTYDPNETILITLTGISGNVLLGESVTHSVTLTEPVLVVEFANSSSSLLESGNASIGYNFNLPAGVTPIVSPGGTATVGVDFTYLVTESGISITAISDGFYDPNETVVFTITGVNGNGIPGTVITHTVTLTEPLLVVGFGSTASSLGEGNSSTITYDIILPVGVTPTISLGGTATEGADFSYTFTQTGVAITALADGVYDPNETLIITLTGISGNGQLGTVTTHTVTLTEPALVVAFAASSSSLGEGNIGTVAYNIILPDGVTPSVSLGGTATEGTDFTYAITQTGITITPVADGLYDPNETVIISLTTVSGNAVLGTVRTHTITFTEPPLVVQFTGSSSILGEGNTGTVSFNLSLPAGVTPTLSFGGTATAGSDYSYTVNESGISITAVSDAVFDINETIIINLTGVSGNAIPGTVKTHTITLTEPAFVIEFSSASSSIGEGGGGTVSYTVPLPNGIGSTFSLSGTAIQGTDYTYSVSQSGITITAVADGLYDPNETVIVTLTGASGAAILGALTTHTITFTEPPLVVNFTSSTSTLGEGNVSTIAFNQTLPAGVTPVLSFGGSAGLGADFTYTLSQTGINITAVADGLYDPNENIVITITGLSGNAVPGTSATHTVTLTESPLLVGFAVASSSLGEGNGSTVLYNLTLPAGVMPTVAVTGTATEGVDFNYSVTAGGIIITTVADGLYDPNETIILSLTGLTGNAALGTIRTHTVTLTEPPLVVEFASTTSTLAEGNVFTIPFNMTLPAGVTPTITTSGTATLNTDYTYVVNSSGVVVTANTDAIVELNETAVFTLTAVSGNATRGQNRVNTMVITEAPAVAEFQLTSSAVNEGSVVNVLYTSILPPGVVPVLSLGGTATSGADYTFTIGSDGVSFTAVSDGVYEPNETVIITMTGVSGNGTLGTVVTHTLTINELPLSVGFAASSSSVQEGSAGTVAFNVNLPAEVQPSFTIGGSATLGVDYNYTTLPGGILINVLDEWFADPDETVSITLTGVTGNALLGTNTLHTVTLTDPPAPNIDFAASASTVEEGQSVTLLFNQTLPSGVLPTLQVEGSATSGTDYQFTVTQQGVVIQATNDALLDADETINLTITGFNNTGAELGTILQHNVTIADKPFTAGFATASSTLTEGSSGAVSFFLPLPFGVNPSFAFAGTAIQGLDYNYALTPSGITINTLEEWVFDPDETIVITITGFEGNTTSGNLITHTLTISDGQGQIVEFSSGGSVGSEGQTLVVPFNSPLPTGVVPVITLDGSAINGSDYTYTLNPSDISFTLLRDAVVDDGETISITITGFNVNNLVEFGTLLSHTLTLSDVVNVIGFADSGLSVTEGESKTVNFTFPLPAGVNPAVSFGGTASINQDFTYAVTEQGVVITANEEWSYDPNETIIITMTGVSGNAVLGTSVTYTLTINDPTSLLVGFAAPASNVTEGQNVTVAFNAPLTAGLIPTISLGGTATPDIDYVYNITSAGIVFYTLGDGDFDADETITVTLTGFNSSAGDLGTAITHNITIQDTPLVLGFQSITSRRVEGTSIVLALNQQLPAGVTPIFTVGGTATSTSDYTYVQTRNGFVFSVKKDDVYDPEETVVIQLTGFTGNVVTGTNNTHTLTIEDEDEKSVPRLLINLNWNAGNGTPGDVDMDLLIWYESSPGSYTLKFISDNPGQTFESVSIPSNEINGRWGISYVYYGGTSNNLTLTANFRSYKGNINQVSNKATYSATYTLANINPWDVSQIYRIEQFYDKVNNNYNVLTGISVPSTRSREEALKFIFDKSVIQSKKLSPDSR